MLKFLKCTIATIVMMSLASLVVTASEPMPAQVSSSEIVLNQSSESFVINLNECERVAVDSEGNILPQPRLGLSSHTIGSGVTMYYYNFGTTGWEIPRGKNMTFKVTTEGNPNYEMGYNCNGKRSRMTYRPVGNKRTATAKCSADGMYSFYITNQTSDPMTVVGGEIYF